MFVRLVKSFLEELALPSRMGLVFINVVYMAVGFKQLQLSSVPVICISEL